MTEEWLNFVDQLEITNRSHALEAAAPVVQRRTLRLIGRRIADIDINGLRTFLEPCRTQNSRKGSIGILLLNPLTS